MRHIIGGIGDILLSLEDALFEDEIEVYSHYKYAPTIFTPFKIRVHFHYYKNAYRYRPQGMPLPKKKYPIIEIPKLSLRKARSLSKKERVIGIHPVGSHFSNKVLSGMNEPVKKIPKNILLKMIEELDDGKTTFLIFVAPSERKKIRIKKTNVFIVSEENIWDAFAYVCLCDFVIGVDSAIKTMSLIKEIPTIVLLGDYSHEYRDKYFIDPYVRDGILRVIRFKKLSECHIRHVCSAVKAWELEI